VQIDRLQQLAREALDELRLLILELRPPDLERDGLAGALRKEVDMLRQLHDVEILIEVEDGVGTGSRDADVLRIAQEALHNALRHAAPDHVSLRVAGHGDRLLVEVRDDGAGFEPGDTELRSKHLGLTSMEERARSIGGRLELRSAPGAGTVVRLEVANGG
jgi:signal transduction histidine kinase